MSGSRSVGVRRIAPDTTPLSEMNRAEKAAHYMRIRKRDLVELVLLKSEMIEILIKNYSGSQSGAPGEAE